MLVTIVTLYRAKQCDSFVGAVKGPITDEQRQELANRYELVADPDGDGNDYMGFCEAEVQENPGDLKKLFNAAGDTARDCIEAFVPDESDDFEDDEDDDEDEDDETPTQE